MFERPRVGPHVHTLHKRRSVHPSPGRNSFTPFKPASRPSIITSARLSSITSPVFPKRLNGSTTCSSASPIPMLHAVAAAYNFAPFSQIVDIGGATGHMLTTVLAEARRSGRDRFRSTGENQTGASELIQSRGMSSRASFSAGSFFESVPSGADLYMMSHVLHDWSEQQCLAILGNCHKSMPANGRLLIIEMVLPEDNSFHPGKMLDISMLTLTPGQERSEVEYRALLEKAGFHLSRVIPTSSTQVSIVRGSAALGAAESEFASPEYSSKNLKPGHLDCQRARRISAEMPDILSGRLARDFSRAKSAVVLSRQGSRRTCGCFFPSGFRILLPHRGEAKH